jgi:hypothetical protein
LSVHARYTLISGLPVGTFSNGARLKKNHICSLFGSGGGHCANKP